MDLLVAAVGLIAATWAMARPRFLDDGFAPAGGDPAGGTDGGSDGRVLQAGRRMSVIVPARNEAATLPALLTSLRQSSPPPGEVIVVDDASTDDTAHVASQLGATVVRAGPLPNGWAGKPWACATGARAARMPLLVFVDADTVLGRDALRALDQGHQRHGGLCSVQPFHATGRAREQLSALFNAIAVLGSGQFTARRALGRHPVAFGPCMMTTASDYHASGGHAAVRGSVIEDLALAAAYRDKGLPTTCWLGGRLVSFRMYPRGIRSMTEGWTKNIALGAQHAAPLPVATGVVWIASMAWVAMATIRHSIAWMGGGALPVATWGAYFFVALHLHRFVLRRLGSFGPGTSVLFPVPLLFFIGVFLRSAVFVVLRRPVRWRGRDIATGPARGG